MGSEELNFRQAARNIDRCLSFGGGIRRDQRRTFDGFLNHGNPRVKEYAQQLKLKIDLERKAWRGAIEADERTAMEFPETIGGAPYDFEPDQPEVCSADDIQF